MNIELQVDPGRSESEQIQIAVMGLLDEDKEDLVLWIIDVSCLQLNSPLNIYRCAYPAVLNDDPYPRPPFLLSAIRFLVKL